jgi:enoyl-CoA hydratase/carnithine racemase
MQALASPSPHLQAFHDGSIGWLVLNRPERRNALNAEMWAAIPPMMKLLDDSIDVRTIVIRGAGSEAFAAGADISEFAAARSNAGAARAYEELNGAAFAAIRGSAKPVIAMFEGFCIGGGLAIALAADLRVTGTTGLFALPPARLGPAYPLDGLRDLLAAVSLAVAKEMLFTARRLTADEALQAGLVNQIASDPEAAVRKLAADIADGAPLTIKASKRALDTIAGRTGAASPGELDRLAAQCFDSEDYAEGRAAFLAKRKPSFKGY